MASKDEDLKVWAVPTFTDNYVWLIEREGRVVVVDPGDGGPVRRAIEERGLLLDSILITHHHGDHVGGVAELLAWTPVSVSGPRAEADKIGTLSRLLDDGDTVEVLGRTAQVLAIPGHTLGHIAFHFEGQGLLFCGDTLFAAGCGRLFEGTAAQMHGSLSRLAALADATGVYCAHEYTLANLAFAAAVDPGNPDLPAHLVQMRARRERGEPTLPSSIAVERAVNPFLRTAEPAIRAAVRNHAGAMAADGDSTDVFAALRLWKDDFRPSAAP